jgi:hypothetical protein
MREGLCLVLILSSAGCNGPIGDPGPAGGGGGGGGNMMPGGGGNEACAWRNAHPGEAISTPADEWTWVPIAGSRCRDGSDTGIGVRAHPGSDKLLIYLEGGGACFNGFTCGANPRYFGTDEFDRIKGRASGIFDMSDARNPFKDWSFVYIPYCTGDVHAGATDGDVPSGPKAQHFDGFGNVSRALAHLSRTFAEPKRVVITGASAGGFGAAWNYEQATQAFCKSPVTLIDDSGPPLPDTYMPGCLQERWRQTWNLDATLPAECTDCRASNGGGLVHYGNWLASRHPDARFALISSDKDSVISRFFGFGKNDCAGIDGAGNDLAGDVFRTGLIELRTDWLSKSPQWGSYFIPSTQHTWIGGSGFYRTNTGGVSLADWITQLLAGQTSHVGP